MASKSAGSRVSPQRPDPFVLRLAMAFGQGASRLRASDKALEAALSAVTKLPRPKLSRTDLFEELLLSFARLAGTLAEHGALADGDVEIQVSHIRQALKAIRSSGSCGCFPPFKTIGNGRG